MGTKHDERIDAEVAEANSREIEVRVTVQVSPDEHEHVSESVSRLAAEQAIRNALQLVEANGFSHDFADRLSIGLVAVDARQDAQSDLLEALRGCADALREAGKGFALSSPLAARPNLYELHEQVARAAIGKAEGK